MKVHKSIEVAGFCRWVPENEEQSCNCRLEIDGKYYCAKDCTKTSCKYRSDHDFKITEKNWKWYRDVYLKYW